MPTHTQAITGYFEPLNLLNIEINTMKALLFWVVVWACAVAVTMATEQNGGGQKAAKMVLSVSVAPARFAKYNDVSKY